MPRVKVTSRARDGSRWALGVRGPGSSCCPPISARSRFVLNSGPHPNRVRSWPTWADSDVGGPAVWIDCQRQEAEARRCPARDREHRRERDHASLTACVAASSGAAARSGRSTASGQDGTVGLMGSDVCPVRSSGVERFRRSRGAGERRGPRTALELSDRRPMMRVALLRGLGVRGITNRQRSRSEEAGS